MINNTLAIHVDSPQQFGMIDFIKQQYPNYDDVLLVTDNGFSSPNYAVIPMFYIKFFKGKIVFLSVDSFLQYRDNFNSNQIGLKTTLEEIQKYNIDLNKLHLDKVF
jgi:hypothetical protein